MPTLDIAEDEGYLTVNLPGDGGQPLTRRLDLFRAHNVYAQLADQHDPEKAAVDLGDAWVEWLVEQGLPPVSHGAAFRVAAAVRDAVAAVKKNTPGGSSASAGSPASTASTPSGSTPSPN